MEEPLSNEERQVRAGTPNYPTSTEGKVSEINMAECFSSWLEKTSEAKQPLEEIGDIKQKKKERKLRLRYVTDEMLEKYRLLSEESDKWKRSYEEAAFKVYGTLPPGKGNFKSTMKNTGGQNL